MGGFIDQKTKQVVKQLAPHQVEMWNDIDRSNYYVCLKSQKIGISTVALMKDFNIALTRGRGQEILIIAQSQKKAEDHLQDLQKMILRSKYRDFLINNKSNKEGFLSDEQTKVNTIYLRNPGYQDQTKIIALGITNPGALISFKRVCHIHLSDITLADMTNERMDESLGGVHSRLANTNGTLLMELPPRGPSGPIFEIVNEDESMKKDGIAVDLQEGKEYLTSGGYLVRRYTVEVGLKCGMITPEFNEKEKKRLGPRYGMYYMASFYSSDKTWFDREHTEQVSDEATEMYERFSRGWD